MRTGGDIRGHILIPIKRASYCSKEVGRVKSGNQYLPFLFYMRATQKIRGQIRTSEDIYMSTDKDKCGHIYEYR